MRERAAGVTVPAEGAGAGPAGLGFLAPPHLPAVLTVQAGPPSLWCSCLARGRQRPRGQEGQTSLALVGRHFLLPFSLDPQMWGPVFTWLLVPSRCRCRIAVWSHAGFIVCKGRSPVACTDRVVKLLVPQPGVFAHKHCSVPLPTPVCWLWLHLWLCLSDKAGLFRWKTRFIRGHSWEAAGTAPGLRASVPEGGSGGWAWAHLLPCCQGPAALRLLWKGASSAFEPQPRARLAEVLRRLGTMWVSLPVIGNFVNNDDNKEVNF